MARSPPARVLGLIVLLTLGASCTPSVPALVKDGRYDEALCAYESADRWNAADKATLFAAVTARMAPTLEVRAFTPRELEERIAGTRQEDLPYARAAAERVLAVRVRASWKKVATGNETDFAQFWAALSSGKGFGSLTHDRLLAMFHETTPSSHVEGPSVGDHVGAWANNAAEHPIANALTLGLWSVVDGPSARPRTVEPSPAERLTSAPITERLEGAFARAWSERSDDPSRKATNIVLFYDRSDPPPTGVDVLIELAATEGGGPFKRFRTCNTSRGMTIPLPARATVEESLAALFPTGPRPLSSLDVHAN